MISLAGEEEEEEVVDEGDGREEGGRVWEVESRTLPSS